MAKQSLGPSHMTGLPSLIGAWPSHMRSGHPSFSGIHMLSRGISWIGHRPSPQLLRPWGGISHIWVLKSRFQCAMSVHTSYHHAMNVVWRRRHQTYPYPRFDGVMKAHSCQGDFNPDPQLQCEHSWRYLEYPRHWVTWI